ncbi:Flp family type IVb pilin [Pseudomonas fildesensis]|uniref:Pilus assembly protein n=1 Tax=Pseudomonas fildesensis TaxID=1674920 RepID=A0A0J8IVC1_9PSED|nr:Flp family type IVb pilin [Pseudomonas fildesensis]KMT55811.1 pilus assembly protein [Pseudomonas fildesensis]
MFLTLVMKLYIQLQLFVRRREGATAIEYVILVAIVALVILAAGTGLGTSITNFFARVGAAIGT